MILALGAWLLVSCAPSVSVTVISAASAPLDSLVVMGTIGPKRLRDLAPAESVRVSIEVPGEDMLQLRGRLAGRPLPRPFGCYVEPGARVRIEVQRDGTQRITTQLPGEPR